MTGLNTCSHDELVQTLLTVCHSHRWAEAVAAAAPYDSLGQLQQIADDTWLRLEPSDWREALDGHPRIGEQGGAAPDSSKREQSAMADADAGVKAAIADGNRRYEQRFGHIFLIAAAGRTPEQILAELHRRLSNDPETELREAAEQHRTITRTRLERLA